MSKAREGENNPKGVGRRGSILTDIKTLIIRIKITQMIEVFH